jgi:ATP-dependent DNA helicase DinG
LPRLLNVLAKHLDPQEDGLFRQLHAQLEGLIRQTMEIAERAVKDLEQAGLDFASILAMESLTEQEVRQRLTIDIRDNPLWPEIVEKLRALAQKADTLAEALASFLKALSKLPEDTSEAALSLTVDLAGQRLRLQALAEQIRAFTTENPDHCAWFEISRSRIGRGEGVLTRICTAPLVVAPLLRSYMLERMQTTVMTSATLTVGQTFDYLRHRVGINDIPGSRVNELHLASPFDFQEQARLVVVSDIPEPGRPGYEEAAREAIEKALIATGGRSFVLFTAYHMLRRIHSELAPSLTAQGFQVFRQGEATRHRLLKQFIQDPTSILFATDSFWEGVDVPGRSLEQVIIARLPFKVPSDPIVEARAEAIAKEGKDPFMEFTVPEAVIRFRQGFGRLIRQKTDRGAVLILDSRVVRRGYGRLFLNSLPNVPIEVIESGDISTCLNRFFSDTPEQREHSMTGK